MRRIILGIAMFLTSLWSPMELRAAAAASEIRKIPGTSSSPRDRLEVNRGFV